MEDGKQTKKSTVKDQIVTGVVTGSDVVNDATKGVNGHTDSGDEAVSVDAVLKPVSVTDEPVFAAAEPDTLKAIDQPPDITAAYMAPPPDDIINETPPVLLSEHITRFEKYYLEHRWFSELNHNKRKAADLAKTYKNYQIILIVASLMLPFLLSLNLQNPQANRIVYYSQICLSLLVATITAYLNVKGFNERAASHRQLVYDLEREKVIFDNSAGIYGEQTFSDDVSEQDKSKQLFSLFVHQCEKYIEREQRVLLQIDTAGLQMTQELAGDALEKTKFAADKTGLNRDAAPPPPDPKILTAEHTATDVDADSDTDDIQGGIS